MSEELDTLLDENGLSEDSVKIRRIRWDMWSYLMSSSSQTSAARHVSGSLREGVAIEGDSQSDLDIMMIVFSETVVCKNSSTFSPADSRYEDLLIMEDTDHVGYKRISKNNGLPLRSDCVTELTPELYDILRLYENDLCSTHGPAFNYSWIESDLDFVLSYKCLDFPRDAEEWRYRKRLYGWPPQNIIDRIVSIGCHLVGVSSSPEIKDEWRVSFSMAENILVRSFNNTQLKCYALVKMILKSVDKSVVSDALSSFHVKTIMFWLFEQTPPSLWIKENLHKCFRTCVGYLRHCVVAATCPHYFMKSINLFQSKVTTSNRRDILRCIDEILRYPINMRVREILANRKVRDPFSYYLQNVYMTASFTMDIYCNYIETVIKYNPGLSLEMAASQYHNTVKISSAINVDQTVIQVCPNFFEFSRSCFRLASLFDSNATNKTIYSAQKKIFQTLERFSSFDLCAGKLKLATFYLKTNKLKRCIALCEWSIKKLEGPHVRFSFRSDLEVLNPECDWRAINDCCLLPNKLFTDFICMDVTFSHLEIKIVPKAVEQEIKRHKEYFSQDMENNLPEQCCYYDPHIYVFYLLLICYHDLGEPSIRDECFKRLQNLFLTSHMVYKEAASFLIEHCATFCNTL